MDEHLQTAKPRNRRRVLGSIVGETFAMLCIKDERRSKEGLGKSTFEVLARCTCGVEKWVEERSVRRGLVTSCGSCANRTHGASKTPEYAVWRSMLDRCRLQTHPAYKNYGGRGITVCERWQEFKNFYADMGAQPFKGASIDRVDNNAGYCKDNCRWANNTTQSRNRRNNRMLRIGEETLTVAEWSARSGVRHNTILYRLNHCWQVKDAVFRTPNFANNKKDC